MKKISATVTEEAHRNLTGYKDSEGMNIETALDCILKEPMRYVEWLKKDKGGA